MFISQIQIVFLGKYDCLYDISKHKLYPNKNHNVISTVEQLKMKITIQNLTWRPTQAYENFHR